MRNIPHWLILNAANVYDVSVDFIYGITPDWERDERIRLDREIHAYYLQVEYINHAKRINEIRKRDNKITALSRTVATLPPAVLKITERFKRFVELNPEFIDMPAGNMVLVAVDEADQAAKASQAALTRYRAIPNEQ